MTRRGVLGLLAGGMAMVIAGCSSRDRLRYKMTVEVETPEGTKSGYSVREVTFSPKSGTFFAEGSATWKLRGEAVVLELPDGRILLALLKGASGQTDYAGRNVWQMLTNESAVEIEHQELRPKFSRIEKGRNIPMLATFSDINDPSTIQKVNPNDLATSFGPGVTLKRILIEKTSEPVTIGIEEKLRWLPNGYKNLIGTDFRPEGIPVGDFKGLFSTELSK